MTQELIQHLKEETEQDLFLGTRLLLARAADALEQQATEIEEVKCFWKEEQRMNRKLQAKLDTAIQSSAHWQHQCTELQAKLAAMEAVAQPLTDEQIEALNHVGINAWNEHEVYQPSVMEFARAIEAAHGIGGQQP